MLDEIAPDWREHVGYAGPHGRAPSYAGHIEITANHDRDEPSDDRDLWVATVKGTQELQVAVHVSRSAAASGTRGTGAYIVQKIERL